MKKATTMGVVMAMVVGVWGVLGATGCATVDVPEAQQGSAAIVEGIDEIPVDDTIAKWDCPSNDGTLYCVVSGGKLTGEAKTCDGQQSKSASECSSECPKGEKPKNTDFPYRDRGRSCPHKKKMPVEDLVEESF